MKRRVGCSVVIVVLLVSGYVVSFPLRQFNAEIDSLVACEDNGIGAWRTILQEFANEHTGRMPTAGERQQLAQKYRAESSHFQLKCDTGAPYQWAERVTRVAREGEKPVPVVWCGRPHGVTRRWRNVLYSDLVVRKVPEVTK